MLFHHDILSCPIRTWILFFGKCPDPIIVSTEAVDTMDLARVRRRRSVVRDFTVTALQPTVFYLELLYLQVMFSLRKSCLGIFLASF